MNKIKYLIIICTILVFQRAYSQNDVYQVIKLQAQKLAMSVYEGNYDTLVKFTHPRIIEIVGGKDAMLSMVKTQMFELEKQNITIDKIEIGDSIVCKIYNNEYHALVPKISTLSLQGKKVMSKSYLFGFSDTEGENWTFLEADKLRTKDASKIIPNFKTNIDIPEKSQPIFIENFSDDPMTMQLQISWDKLEINRRHDLEEKIDKLLREGDLGYCSGGDNGKHENSEVNIYLTIGRNKKQEVIDIIDNELTKLNLESYEWLIFE